MAAAAPPALRKGASAGSSGNVNPNGHGKSIDQQLAEAAEKLRAKTDAKAAVDKDAEQRVWARFEEKAEVSGRAPHTSLATRLCNAAYLGDLSAMHSVLEQAAAERKAREQAEREEEEKARIAAEAEEWTVDVKGNKTRKMKGHHNEHGPSAIHPALAVGKDKDKDSGKGGDAKKGVSAEQERAEAEAAWNAMRQRQQQERDRREIERAARRGVVDEHALVRFQWGEEGVRVVRLANGRYSFRLDSFGVPAPALFYACMTGQIEAVRLLKRYKADAAEAVALRWPQAGEITDSGVESPAHHAAAAAAAGGPNTPFGVADTAYGARVDVTAWDVAFENGHHDCAQELGAKRQCRACTSPASPCALM